MLFKVFVKFMKVFSQGQLEGVCFIVAGITKDLILKVWQKVTLERQAQQATPPHPRPIQPY
jgi:hypothetical protein